MHHLKKSLFHRTRDNEEQSARCRCQQNGNKVLFHYQHDDLTKALCIPSFPPHISQYHNKQIKSIEEIENYLKYNKNEVIIYVYETEKNRVCHKGAF